MKIKKKFLILTTAVICITIFSFISNILVDKCSKYTYNDINEITENKVGLLLGTAKSLTSGYENLYYTYRINATVQLYKNNKIEYILISGDNSRSDYDEPSDMKNDLIKRGIPENKIYLDYAGFRTLDSIIRAKEIFGQNQITIISQQFHNERSIFIAKNKGIKAIGFNAKNVPIKYGIKVIIREKLARVKVVLDIIFNKKPKFLGDKIAIG